MKKILVTGGAGYIGSIVVKNLINEGYNVVVVDNLSKGIKKLVDPKAEFHKVDLVNKKSLELIFKKHKFDAVMHFAAYKAVGESMENPAKYSQNISGTINLLDLMVKYNVPKIVYSSSAAVYGLPKEKLITETHPLNPTNYYGFTKRICEGLVKAYAESHKINYVIFRYFNVAGDGGLGYIDPSAENVLPVIMNLMSKKKTFTIYGKDYPTRDGTCIRDYVDVTDLANVHIKALDLEKSEIINLGTGRGVSVKELVDSIVEVIGKKFKYKYGERRPGDCAIAVASNKKAQKLLNWKPQKNLKDMIKSTYEAYSKIL